MKISGSFGNNINFIEQKTNTLKTSQSQSKISAETDTFTSKSSKTTNLGVYTESLGLIDIAYHSLSNLKESGKNLQELSEQFSLTQESNSLHVEFEEGIEKMLDVIDNTIYNNTQIFYTNFSFSQTMPSFMLSEIINIEDLNIQDKEGLEVFETKLYNLQEELTKTKEHLGIVSFNSLAAMSSNQEISKESLKELQSHLTQDISHEELLKAHNTELLKDKISSLLAD
jgi:hypothetical protein